MVLGAKLKNSLMKVATSSKKLVSLILSLGRAILKVIASWASFLIDFSNWNLSFHILG